MRLDSLVSDIGDLFQTEGDLVERPLLLRGDRVEARLGDLLLSSVFRGIRAASHPRRVEGLQASLRVFAEGATPRLALDIFAAAQDTVAVINLDRLCRALHLLNFLPKAGDGIRLFLPVNPFHVTGVKQNHGAYFENILARCGITPELVTICVPIGLSSGRPNPSLIQGLSNYRSRGYQIALQSNDRPGTEDTDLKFSRSFRPDYLFLQHGISTDAAPGLAEQRLSRLKLLTSAARRLGIRTVISGIDTARQAELCAAAGADLLIGDYYEYSGPTYPSLSRAETNPIATEINPQRFRASGWQRSEIPALDLLGRRWQYSSLA